MLGDAIASKKQKTIIDSAEIGTGRVPGSRQTLVTIVVAAAAEVHIMFGLNQLQRQKYCTQKKFY